MMRSSRSFVLFVAGVTILACVTPVLAQPQEFSNWPAGASPAEVGKRVAENFVVRKLECQTGRRDYVIYPEVCAWYGSLTVAKLIKDPNLTDRLVKKFEPLLGPEAKRISPTAHVDYRVFGAVPLEIYMQTKDKRYLEIGQGLADKQWENPTEDGITREARYWIDDMFMIPAVQVQAFRATKDAKYIDRAALAMVAYLDKLQQPNGLFFHASDSPFFWSRGNGWFAAGMAELLSSLPQDHPKRARIMDGYKKMMGALLAAQDPNGMWHQLIDKLDFWPETSGTGMFAYAMVTGVKNGWLDAKTYAPAARKAWLGLVKYLDADANIQGVCVGTNKAAQEVGPDLATQQKYYFDRQRKTGDLHGQAPVLWTATALLR